MKPPEKNMTNTVRTGKKLKPMNAHDNRQEAPIPAVNRIPGFGQGGAEITKIYLKVCLVRGGQRGRFVVSELCHGRCPTWKLTCPFLFERRIPGTHRTVTLPDANGTPRPIEVRIPAGVRNGERLRVKGKGSPGRGGGPPGNLFFHVHIAPHPVFHRKNSDIVINLPVWPWEAALGTDVQVPTLSGPVRLKIPPNSQPQQRMRLKGKGLPKRTGGHGDQFVVLSITMPTDTSPEDRHLYEQLAKADHPDPRSSLLHEAIHE